MPKASTNPITIPNGINNAVLIDIIPVTARQTQIPTINAVINPRINRFIILPPQYFYHEYIQVSLS